MSKDSGIWEGLKTTIKFWLAGFAIKHSGIEVIFWSAPQRWEEYMKKGTPFAPEAAQRNSETHDRETEG